MLVFFAPDLSFAFYAFGPKVGAAAYNTVHLYGFGAVVAMVALLGRVPGLAEIGMLWIAHAGFDRMLGYGLKLPSGFHATHLGRIGRG